MAQVEMVMPKMGESIMEATVLSWLKKEGDTIEQDESVLEVATDKVDTEVPATHAGKLAKILAKDGDVVPVGNPIAIIETEAVIEESEIKDPGPKSKVDIPSEVKQGIEEMQKQTETIIKPLEKPQSGRFYSPLVMSIAKEENISMDELETVPGTGKEGRVSKKDILAYLDVRKTGKIVAKVASGQTAGAHSMNGQNEIIEMDRMRKMIADRMLESKRTSPHVTSFVEADVTNIVNWRNKNKAQFEKKEGQKLTFTPIFVEAIVKAIKDFPMINISVDGHKIIRKNNINIGMAVALRDGNLIVPVIKNADQLNLKGIALKVNDLAERARINKLNPDDLSDGTYTISNVGSFGNVMGTPIIVQPQVAIMAVGSIKKKPAVIETEQGDLIGIRHMMFLSHSYDHRVVDGSLGGMFVRRVADYLEQFDINQSI
ncbi:2-oxo acid dehydrogenase subunit E2 [Hyphobacterium sp. CCMP332]|nr:2-oxo acid dehydrogenase subunit E2 [Hyphobacterium sp. CCMP332]